MTRQRQKQEGKRKGYGKFLPVKRRRREKPIYLHDVLSMPFETGMVIVAPKKPSLVSAVWVDGKRRTVAELIANGKRKFESARKAAGKEGTK